MPVWFHFLLIWGFCNGDKSDYRDSRRLIWSAGAGSIGGDANLNSTNVFWSLLHHLCHCGLELLLTGTCQPSSFISNHMGFWWCGKASLESRIRVPDSFHLLLIQLSVIEKLGLKMLHAADTVQTKIKPYPNSQKPQLMYSPAGGWAAKRLASLRCFSFSTRCASCRVGIHLRV